MSSKIDVRELHEWLRNEIGRNQSSTLAHGYQANVRLYRTPFGTVVVKSPHRASLKGLIGRATIKHEHEVYNRLQGIGGIPHCFGLIDGEHLVLEYIEGASLRRQPRLEDPNGFYARLLSTLQQMHRAGVAHGDLKRKDNLIVGAGEQPYIVDFGIAAVRPESRWGLRAIRFRLTEQLDNNAWIKLKYGRRAEAISPEDLELYRPLWIERIARWLRIGWQNATLRRPRQRWRKRREAARAAEGKESER